MHYVLFPGAACTSWHWHPVTDEPRRRGAAVTPVDLPCDDPAAMVLGHPVALVEYLLS
ncbi:hypothetical protein AB0I34_29915 [Kribbella sp. NPDC050281]|uniref:hypothetical protein n=1 Tax=Kribbella sp. NPDC050281 TaxID=3155515 RepID=UPI0033C2F974